MARQLRINCPDAYYHVMNRGKRREDIFVTNHDRKAFLDRLADSCEIYYIKLSAYVFDTIEGDIENPFEEVAHQSILGTHECLQLFPSKFVFCLLPYHSFALRRGILSLALHCTLKELHRATCPSLSISTWYWLFKAALILNQKRLKRLNHAQILLQFSGKIFTPLCTSGRQPHILELPF